MNPAPERPKILGPVDCLAMESPTSRTYPAVTFHSQCHQFHYPIGSKDCNYCIHSPTTGLFESLPFRLLSEQSFKKTIYGTCSLKSIWGFHALLCAPSPWFFTLLGWNVRNRKLHLAKTRTSRRRRWTLRQRPLIVPMQSSPIKQWYLLGCR